MNEDMPSVNSEWNTLLENNNEIVSYIMDSLMIRPEECKVVKIQGRTKHGVQLCSIERSIRNNADPEKNGLTYLSMRAIHYWKTLYESRVNDPDIDKSKITKAMHDDIRNTLYAEIKELNNMISGKGVVDKYLYDKATSERDEWESKYNKLDDNYNKNLDIAIETEKKYANQEVIRLESKVKFLEEELRKMSKSAQKH